MSVITNPSVPNTRILTINGSAQDLSEDREWVVGSPPAVSSVFTYNPDGTIKTIVKADGETLTFAYSGGKLSTISNGTWTKTFNYTDGKLTGITVT